MQFSELAALPAEQLSAKLASLAVVQARLRKTGSPLAAIGNMASQIKDNIVQGVLSGDPRYTAGVGAAALGGLSGLRELARPARKRQWSNPLMAAGLGGIMGAAIPATLTGLQNIPPTLDLFKPSTPALTEQAGQAIDATAGGLTGTMGAPAQRAGQALKSVAQQPPVQGLGYDRPLNTAGTALATVPNTLGGAGLTAALRGAKSVATLPDRTFGGIEDALKRVEALPGTQAGPPAAAVTGVDNAAMRTSVEHMRNATNTRNPISLLAGRIDQQLAARKGHMPYVDGWLKANPGAKVPQQPFTGRPLGSPKMPRIGDVRTPASIASLRRPVRHSGLSLIPLGAGIAADVYNNFFKTPPAP